MSLERLLSAARAGDHEAFRLLVEPHLPALYRTAALVLLDGELARDAVQEGLVRAYRSLGRFRGEQFQAWLYRLVSNEARRLASRTRREPALLSSLLEAPDPPETTPEYLYMARERRERLWQALAALGPLHRTALVLRYYRDLSDAEMARVLGIPPGTVKSRLNKARLRLKALLDRDRAAPHTATPVEARRSGID